ncbi:hypothetical protein D9758_006219 [Tetrapyrgos nigripes]|uniref:Peptidase S9 prolyl oligopeptidase catalytic domain-containing protein n=1 Tax=Tetrapyrgos nigripes TaxID=182062 RepID=A0A8H5LL92_9AGAR|nr:hypothetical protein D9758_006219 [Tetrapyrgos nigripes]
MRAPHGTWQSPISAESITGSVTTITEAIVDPKTETVYHVESRPSEAGRNVLTESVTGREVTGPSKDWNVRTAVHEYGGLPATVNGGIAYFSHVKDNRVYKVDVTAKIPTLNLLLLVNNQAHRFAQICVHPTAPHLLVSVHEDHTIDEPASVVNNICLIDTNAQSVSVIVSGANFYAFPIFSPDGTRLAWQQWRCLGSAATLSKPITIAGQNNDVSVGWLSWASNSTLLFLSDVSGFSNPWKYDVDTNQSSPIFPKPIKEDFSEVMWSLGMFPYAVIDRDGRFGIFAAWRDGRSIFYLVDVKGRTRKELDSPYVKVDSVKTVSREKGQAVFIGGKANDFPTVVQCTVSGLDSDSLQVTFENLNPPGEVPFRKDMVSIPKGITLEVPPTGDPLHVVYYAPHNPQYEGSSIEGEKPPCVVNVHGGPTGLAYQSLRSTIQYFTSRGWAWLDVNYGGSCCYGRAYMDRLKGQWGPLDTEDCIKAAKLLSSSPHNLIDPKRTVIRGSSSGGLTVCTALSLSSDLDAFAAATSLYGVVDLVGLSAETHKFEAYYMISDVPGATTEEERKKILRERSPVHYADRIRSPLLILQGDIDRVVPKNQAQSMYDNILKAGGQAEFKLYPEEGHGWRKKETQKDALERELDFYERCLGLKTGTEGPGKL